MSFFSISIRPCANKERSPSPSKVPEPKAAAPAAAKGKAKGKEKGGKEKGDKSGSRPPSTQFDVIRPHWILRFVSDGACAEDVEVKKDSERADEIRAMKKAWEEAEPGRAAKALQSRLNYLNSHMIKLQQSDDELAQQEDKEIECDGVTTETQPASDPIASDIQVPVTPSESEAVLSNTPPTPPPPKEMLQPLDTTPFEKGFLGSQLAEKQHEILQWRAYREKVEARRENERKERNLCKIKQIEYAEYLQAQIDECRRQVYEPREAIRQKFLEEERLKQEALAAEEAAKAENSAPSPKGRNKSAKGKKSPSGKKKK